MPIRVPTFLSTTPGLGISESFGINDAGQIVGQENTISPFVWTPNTPNGQTGVLRLLPLLAAIGSIHGIATAINRAGDVVGEANAFDPSGAPVTRAMLWPAAGGVIALGTLIPSFAPPGFFLGDSHALGINDRGVIVGVSDSGSGVEHGFVFDPAVGVMRDLGSLVPFTMLPGTSDPSRAIGINNRGDIVGEATAVDGRGNLFTRAFFLPNGGFAMQDLGTLIQDPSNPGNFLGNSVAFAVNDAGTIVGDSDVDQLPQPTRTPAFFQIGNTPTEMFPSSGSARGINKQGVVVGFIGSPAGNAFRFAPASGPEDLTALSGLSGAVTSAAGINAAGQIAATVVDGGIPKAVLLTF